MDELKTKLNAEKVDLENQWEQLIQLAKTKKDEITKANEDYEKTVQEIRDNQQILRGRYTEIDNVLAMIEQAEKEPVQTEFDFDEIVEADNNTEESTKKTKK